MTAIRVLGGICLGTLVLSGVLPGGSVAAQTPVSRATLTVQAGTIVGAVRDGSDQPVVGARLRLRDLTSGRILMTTRSEQDGQFRFSGVPAGSYVVELVDEGGIVRALGHTFTMAPGMTMTTFIQLGTHAPWYSGFFTNAAMAAVSSAAGLGVTSIGNGLQPASGRF